ncbi:hypothetical protein B0H11DRAFT_2191235 [Mycena galericulata]|nr:hypothetical protein B0H11DRAFT_2191235 [Mycena galericulata]
MPRNVGEGIEDTECDIGVARRSQVQSESERQMMRPTETALGSPTTRTAESFSASRIRFIPTEILLEIFMAAASQPEGIQRVGQGLVPILAQVCADWRVVACDHPALWSSFSCSLFGGLPEISLLEIYLRRCRGATVTVEVNATKNHKETIMAGYMIALLARHSEQISGLYLTGTDWFPIKLHGFRGRLPRLEVLQLPPAHSSDQFAIAPRLHTLIINDGYIHDGIPFSQIHTLHLQHGASPPGLARFTGLTSLTCSMNDILFRRRWYIHVTFPRLASWTIDFGSPVSTPLNFFDYFTAPALASLEIVSLVGHAKAGALIKRSQCDLKRLVLRKSSVRISEVLQIFELSPGLQFFAVEDGADPTAVTDRLLEALAVRTGQTTLLSQLARLRIDGTYRFRDEVLLNMLESRTGDDPQFTLNVVELWLGNRVLKDGYARRLRALEDAGLDISLNFIDQNGDVVGII